MEIAERVREAYEAGRPQRLVGAGTWLEAGRPTVTRETLPLGAHRGIVEYVPGDLTLTARAGTPLADLVAAVRAEGQWLPLDPWGGDEGTLGATISTATPGPHAYSMGLPRDVVLGLEFVTGTGDVVRSGGRVVKNVAGFDLTRLLVGSWGTLGVLTQVTVRLRARPEVTRTVMLPLPSTALALDEMSTMLRGLPFTPLASEAVNAPLAAHVGAGSDAVLLLRVGGNEKSVRGQLERLREFGDVRDAPADVWPRLRVCDRLATASWRYSQLPSRFGETWGAAQRSAGSSGQAFVHGSPSRGVARVVVSGDAADAAPFTPAFDGSVVAERLRPAQWSAAPPVASDSLSRAVRARFDPGRILNPGILEGDA